MSHIDLKRSRIFGMGLVALLLVAVIMALAQPGTALAATCPPPPTQVGGTLSVTMTRDTGAVVTNGQTINFVATVSNNASACTNSTIPFNNLVMAAFVPDANGNPTEMDLSTIPSLAIGSSQTFNFSYTVALNPGVPNFTVSFRPVSGQCPDYCTPHSNVNLHFQLPTSGKRPR